VVSPPRRRLSSYISHHESATLLAQRAFSRRNTGGWSKLELRRETAAARPHDRRHRPIWIHRAILRRVRVPGEDKANGGKPLAAIVMGALGGLKIGSFAMTNGCACFFMRGVCR
jgi:hypothetical protein